MKTTKKIVSVLCIVVIAIATLTLTGCGKKEEKSEDKATLVGTWEYTRGNGSTYAYIFKDDNTGAYSVYGSEMPFTYEDDGEKVTILYNGNTISNTFEYRIEGDKLIIKDSFGDDVEYTKK